MLKKYFTKVPVVLSILVNFLLGWFASIVVLFALLGGLGASIAFIFIAAAAFFLINLILYLICKAVRRTDKPEKSISPRSLALRAAAVIGTFVFMSGSFFWASDLWLLLNENWF